ncbi:LppU/SCO3897 family protein [Micromonospora sp. DT227]|uniref:LppU/SCO3897 family protein n=1 Tax=Micromonospora sp. DT227 TaxID=3393433 RepID=UPI003CED8D66
MTSEAPHHPGQEPGEVSPGTGGPVPYGDQPAQQDNGYNGTPDLGWAPPPPAGRPAPPAPAWAAADDQPPAWAPPAGQHVTGRATAQVPPPADSGGRGAQPAWAGSEQGAPAWAASGDRGPEQGAPAWAGSGPGAPAWGPGESTRPDASGEPAPPAWAPTSGGPAEPAPPAWAAEQHRPARGAAGEQPAWAQPETGARSTGYVPAPATVPNESWVTPAGSDDPHRSGGFTPAAQQGDDAGHSGGWAVGTTAQSDDPNRSGGWNRRDEQAAARSDDPNRSGGWNRRDEQPGAQPDDRSGGWTPRDTQPAWVPPGQQSGATWPPPEPTARAAAKVSVPGAVRPEQAWSTPEQSDQDSRSNPTEDDPHRSGGWQAAGGQQHDEPARSGGWPAPQGENRVGGRDGSTRDDDPDRSGGWAAGGRAAGAAEVPQPAGWGESNQPHPSGWNDAPARPRRDGDDQAGGWHDAPALPQRDADDQAAGWHDAPALPQRGGEGPAGGWGGAAAGPQQRETERPAEEPVRPGWGGNQDERASAEPWSPAEAWGHADEAPPAPSRGWQPAEDGPVYQPAPAPGISPGHAVPLPAQSQRVPGAALAASPPADHAAAAQFGPAERAPQAYEPERGDAGWGAARSAPEEPQSPAGPILPGPRTSPEAGAAGPVSASASVPVASRVTPPADQPAHPTGASTPQPRVYGRPTRPEPEDAPEADDAHGYPGQDAPSAFAGPQARPDDGPGFGSPSRADDGHGFGSPSRGDDGHGFGSPSRGDDGHGFAGPQGRADDAPNFAGQQSRSDDAPAFGGPHSRPDDAPAFGGPQSRPDGPHGYPGQDGPPGFGGPQSRSDGPHGYPGQDGPPGYGGPQSRSDDDPRGYGDRPSSPAGPPPFPVGVPSFVDPPGNNRPANGVHPQDDEQPGGSRDSFGGPGGQQNPFGGPGGHQDAYGGPGGRQDAYGGPGGRPDPFGGPGGQQDAYGPAAGGRASVAVPGQGPGGEPGGFPPAFPPPSPQAPPAWSPEGPADESDQGRFDAFKPDAEPKTEAPSPKVRNGRVLALVLIAAVLILAVPLGLLTLLGKIGGDDKPAGFDPAVGSCIKQTGTTAAPADCGEQGAFTVVSKVDNKDKCADLSQPTVVLQGGGTNRVLCLKPAGQ